MGSMSIRFLFLFLLFLTGLQIYAVPVRIAVPALGEGMEKLKQWTPLVKNIENESEIEINLVIARDNAVIKKGLEDHYYDLAFIDSYWYFLWKGKNFCIPIAQAEVNGKTTRRILLVVNKDSIITNKEDLKDRSIAFTLKNESAAGFYIPLAMLLEKKVDPFSYFKESVFAETFQSIIKGVAYGKLDAGFITSNVYDRKENKSLAGSLRILLSSDPVPGWILIARNGFNREIAVKIKNALTALSSLQEGKKVFNASGLSGFDPVSDKNLSGLRSYIKILEINHAAPE